jgi:hypothetical protein
MAPFCLFLATRILVFPHFFLQLSAGFKFHAFLWLCYPHFSCYHSLTSRKAQTDGQSDCPHSETAVAAQTEFRTVFLCDLLLLCVQFSLN